MSYVSYVPYVPQILAFFLENSFFQRAKIQNKWDCLNSTLASPNCSHPQSPLPDFNLSFLLTMSFPKQCSGVTLSFYGVLQNHQPTTGHRTPAGLPAIIDHQPIDHIRIDPLATYRSSTGPPTTDHRLTDKPSTDPSATNHFISKVVNNKE